MTYELPLMLWYLGILIVDSSSPTGLSQSFNP
jgi:hypothetical protein